MKPNEELRAAVGVEGNPDYEDFAVTHAVPGTASRELTFSEAQIIRSIARGNIDSLAAYLKPPRQTIHSDVLLAFLKTPMRLISGQRRGGAAVQAGPIANQLMESIKNQVVVAIILRAGERQFLDELSGFCRGGLRSEGSKLLPVRIEFTRRSGSRGRPSLPHKEIAAIIADDQAVRRELYHAARGKLTGAPLIAKNLSISRSTVYNIWVVWHEAALADLVVQAKEMLVRREVDEEKLATAQYVVEWHQNFTPLRHPS